MRVSAEIETVHRRIIKYLLSPLMQAVKEAVREVRMVQQSTNPIRQCVGRISRSGRATRGLVGVIRRFKRIIQTIRKVTLARDWMEVDGHQKKFRAGMRVSAEIKTGSRRVIEYLPSPVVQAVKEAERER